MRVPLAWRNLKHQLTRTIVAVAGVAFALLLIFMQLGFYGGVERTATQLYDVLDFDLVMVSSQYVDLNQTRSFSQERLVQAMNVPGVASAVPFGVYAQRWKNMETGKRRSIMVVGFDPADQVFRAENFEIPSQIREGQPKLVDPATVMIDTRSRAEFGSKEPGTPAELGSLPVTVVGNFTLGTGFSADGLVLVNSQTYRRAIGLDLKAQPNFGLLKLAEGYDPQQVADELNERLPADVKVVPRAPFLAAEQRHWVWDTSVGIIFTIGVVVAIIVGVVFVYQVMASDISNHLSEYATLKAIGYKNNYLTQVVLQQALILGVLGYIPGFLTALGLYSLARPAGIPAYMTLPLATAVLAMGLAMVSVSGLMAVRKAKAANPADLF